MRSPPAPSAPPSSSLSKISRSAMSASACSAGSCCPCCWPAGGAASGARVGVPSPAPALPSPAAAAASLAGARAAAASAKISSKLPTSFTTFVSECTRGEERMKVSAGWAALLATARAARAMRGQVTRAGRKPAVASERGLPSFSSAPAAWARARSPPPAAASACPGWRTAGGSQCGAPVPAGPAPPSPAARAASALLRPPRPPRLGCRCRQAGRPLHRRPRQRGASLRRPRCRCRCPGRRCCCCHAGAAARRRRRLWTAGWGRAGISKLPRRG